MPTYLAQVTLDNDTALAKDQVVNTFHLSGSLVDVSDAEIISAFKGFYSNAPTGGSNTIAARMSSELAGTGRVRLYNLADPTPRVPVRDVTFTGIIFGGTALPAEVACCLSFKATPVAGVSAARRRNRVFIGPLAQSALASTTNPKIDGAFRNDLTLALQDLKTNIQTSAGGTNPCTLVGYSPTDGTTWTIATAWVDDAPDTQRRRGIAPAARTTRAIT